MKMDIETKTTSKMKINPKLKIPARVNMDPEMKTISNMKRKQKKMNYTDQFFVKKNQQKQTY